jgi:pimeloyl-ACP methyl ester carboxylesterase
VIAVELQGHGHTRDIARPLTYDGMAADIAALLDGLGIERAHFVGYSMGGAVALQLALVEHHGMRLTAKSRQTRTHGPHSRSR